MRLGKNGGDRRSEEARQEQPDIVRLKDYGNSREYIVARLERDGFTELAELAEQVAAGKSLDEAYAQATVATTGPSPRLGGDFIASGG